MMMFLTPLFIEKAIEGRTGGIVTFPARCRAAGLNARSSGWSMINPELGPETE